jgi:pimeloyl-ACP methyl ester carboxylesterase
VSSPETDGESAIAGSCLCSRNAILTGYGFSVYLACVVRYFLSRITFSIVWACLLAAGCQSPPVATSDSLRGPPERLTQASAESAAEPDDDAPAAFAHSTRRAFPDQGWWCKDFEAWLTPERAEQGYAIVLPGVEGTSYHNISIARGLIDAEYPGAIEVRDWTTGHWPLFAYHLMALERNRAVARDIASQIVEYQAQFPDRPVTLIGHSGGAAMAVLVLEELPEEHRVTQAILLAAAISPKHDLTQALSRTELGITNFHSWGDVPHLVVGTLAMGTIDREHTVSAGAGGFQVPADLSEEGRALYADRLHQVPYRLEMVKSFNAGGHIGPTNRKFVSQWVAPRLTQAH